MSRFRTGLALGACALLVVPAAASARPGHRSFEKTFPIASRLCTHIASGHGPVKLRPDAGQVDALCATLKTSYTTALGTYFSTVTPLKQQAIALVAQTHEACVTKPSALCKTTRQQNRPILRGLRDQVRTAAAAYRTTIKTSRQAFWNAVHGLRGGATVTPDTGTPAAPTVALPTTV